MNRKIIARKQTNDKHIEIVLGKLIFPGRRDQWATWEYNKETDGYASGHYFDDREKAEADFAKRK